MNAVSGVEIIAVKKCRLCFIGKINRTVRNIKLLNLLVMHYIAKTRIMCLINNSDNYYFFISCFILKSLLANPPVQQSRLSSLVTGGWK